MKKTQFLFNTLMDVMNYFSTEDICRQHLEKVRWSEKQFCPFCGYSLKIYSFKNSHTYKCASCRKKFNAKVGTIFEDSKIPLQKWFVAIYLLTAHKKGISSLQLGRDIGVTQKTAWFMLHRLRHALRTKSFNQPLKNIVEIDETYIGGKEKNKHANKRVSGTQGRSTATKTCVLGMIERGGQLQIHKIENVSFQEIGSRIIDNVVLGTKVCTDEFTAYRRLTGYYNHKVINHSEGQYVLNDIHTNTIEGFWSLMKRSIIGIYHFVSAKHLENYLNEFTYRYNNRGNPEESKLNLLLVSCHGRLKYKELIA